MLETIAETTGRAPSAVAVDKTLALFAVIKSSSKYAYQGRYTGKPVAMRVTFLEAGEYPFHPGEREPLPPRGPDVLRAQRCARVSV